MAGGAPLRGSLAALPLTACASLGTALLLRMSCGEPRPVSAAGAAAGAAFVLQVLNHRIVIVEL